METQMLKQIIKESLREVLREERLAFSRHLAPYITDEEQAEIEIELGTPTNQTQKKCKKI
ncbi:MAG: hypothetical protein HC918_07470 [Oscillatoriales cyanobacterium SM2_1_8]|nr:hypothetical protein [Oscillatoriales cyanobacterium SM2_1_8]